MAPRLSVLLVASITTIAFTPLAVQASATAAPPPKSPTNAAAASPRSGSKVVLGPSRGATQKVAGAPNVPKGTGPVRNGNYLTYSLTDRLEVKVNVGSGNLLIRSDDLVLPGVSDDVTLGAVYNSLLVGSGVANGSLGGVWRARVGVDVRLIAADDGSITYVAADGVVGVFTADGQGYRAPGEFKADLVRDGSGWKLTEHESGREHYFTAGGQLDRTEDRNDNVTDFQYNASGHLTKAVSDRGNESARVGQVTTASDGRIKDIHQDGDDANHRSVHYGYSSAGQLTSITQPSTRMLKFEYDAQQRVVAIVTPKARTTVTYDGQHRVTSLTRVTDDVTGKGATTRLAYQSATETQVADANTDLSRPISDVPHTTYTLDDEERVTKTVDPAGNERSTSYTPFFDVATQTAAQGGTTTNSHGANGGQSLTKSTSATGAGVALAYANPATETNPTGNFQASSSVDQQGNTNTLTYNGAGNRTSGKNASAAEAKVDYNDDGTVKTATDPANGDNATRYTYDDLHQLAQIDPPTGSSLEHRHVAWDHYGRLASQDDGNDNTTSYHYDDDDRTTHTEFSGDWPTVVSSYDGAGNLTKRVDDSGTTTYTYDKLNRLTSRRSTSGGDLLGYDYDPVGNLTSVTDKRGTTTYTYDSRNLLTSMKTAGNTRYGFAYDKDGRRTDTYFNADPANTTWTAHSATTYDDSGRVTRTTTTRNSASPAAVFDVSYCYAKHVAGQGCSTEPSADTSLRQWQTDHVTSAVSVFSYDTSNRLTGASNLNGKSYEYGYDANGNRTFVKVDGVETQRFAFNSANQISNTEEDYDRAGQQVHTLHPQHVDIGYNEAGQMDEVTIDATHVKKTYHYAGPDQNELINSGTQKFVYGRPDQNGLPWVQSYSGPAAGQTVYVERDGLGTPLGMRIGSEDYFLVLDGLGSVVNVVRAAGTVAASYRYDPFGGAVSVSETLAQPNPIRFAGGLYDSHSKYTKFGQRWYNADTGRFMSQDPLTFLGDPSKANRYAYAGCNPVNQIDPTGRDFSWCSTGFFAVGVGASVGLFFAPLSAGWSLAVGIAVDAALFVGESLLCD